MVARVSGAGFDPGDEVRHDRVRQLWLLRRHLEVRFEVLNGAQQETLVRLARYNDGLARFAAFLPPGFGVEVKPTLQFLGLGAVAFIAMLDENRANLLLEERDAGRVVRGCRDERCQQECGQQNSHTRIGLMT